MLRPASACCCGCCCIFSFEAYMCAAPAGSNKAAYAHVREWLKRGFFTALPPVSLHSAAIRLHQGRTSSAADPKAALILNQPVQLQQLAVFFPPPRCDSLPWFNHYTPDGNEEAIRQGCMSNYLSEIMHKGRYRLLCKVRCFFRSDEAVYCTQHISVTRWRFLVQRTKNIGACVSSLCQNALCYKKQHFGTTDR